MVVLAPSAITRLSGSVAAASEQSASRCRVASAGLAVGTERFTELVPLMKAVAVASRRSTVSATQAPASSAGVGGVTA